MIKKKKTNIDLIQNAFSLFTQGKQTEALVICKKILRKKPTDINALNLTAIIKDKRGEKEEAIRFFKKAFSLNPKNAEISTNIGITYFELKEYDKAKNYLEKALKLNPSAIDATFNLANIALVEKETKGAISLYEKTLALDPNHVKSHNNMANIYHNTDELEKSEEQYKQALAISPHFLESLIGLTLVLYDAGKKDESLKYGTQVIDIQPENEEILLHLGRIHISKKEIDEAKAVITQSIEISKKRALLEKTAEPKIGAGTGTEKAPEPLPQQTISKSLIIGEIGKECLTNGDFDNAVYYLKESIALSPNSENVINTLGVVYQELRQYEKAIEMFKRSLSLSPDYIPAISNMGNIHLELQDQKTAKEYFDRAYFLDPKNEHSKINSCILALSMQDFEQGWMHYRFRKSVKLNGADYSPDELPTELTGKKLLFIKDQGIGDELFFIRFMKKMKLLGPQISYVTDPKLVPILKPLNLMDELLTEIPNKKDFDLCISIGDIAHLLKHKKAEDTPPPLSLIVDQAESSKVKKVLAEFGPPPYIGITWHAGCLINHKRLDAYLKHIDIEDISKAVKKCPGTVIAIQKDIPHSEIKALSALVERPVLDASVYHDDLPKMLSLLDIIDTYITVSNTNVHMREGLGKKSHVLVCSPPEWRWLENGKRSHWFPNSIIYRQQADRSWDTAITELISDLTRK